MRTRPHAPVCVTVRASATAGGLFNDCPDPAAAEEGSPIDPDIDPGIGPDIDPGASAAAPAATDAPRGARLQAALIDELAIAVLTIAVFAMAVQTGAAGLLAALLAPLVELVGGAAAAGEPPPGLAGAVLAAHWVLIRLLYGVFGEGAPTARTWGKRAAGLRVALRSEAAPGYGVALLRQLVKLGTAVTVVGALPLLRRRPGRLWHDHAAGCRVVAASNEPPRAA